MASLVCGFNEHSAGRNRDRANVPGGPRPAPWDQGPLPRDTVVPHNDEVIRLLIADTQTRVRRSLAVLLDDAEGFVAVGSASRGHELIDLARVTAPDVVLVDLSLPDMDGAFAISELVAVAPAARVLILADKEKETEIADALQAGAIDTVPRGADLADIARAIRAAADRRPQRLIDPGRHWHLRDRGQERAGQLTDRDWDVPGLLHTDTPTRSSPTGSP